LDGDFALLAARDDLASSFAVLGFNEARCKGEAAVVL
jgi:hypothetical protein